MLKCISVWDNQGFLSLLPTCCPTSTTWNKTKLKSGVTADPTVLSPHCRPPGHQHPAELLGLLRQSWKRQMGEDEDEEEEEEKTVVAAQKPSPCAAGAEQSMVQSWLKGQGRRAGGVCHKHTWKIPPRMKPSEGAAGGPTAIPKAKHKARPPHAAMHEWEEKQSQSAPFQKYQTKWLISKKVSCTSPVMSLSIYIKSFLKRCSTTSSPHATTGSLQKPWSSVSPYQ